MYSPRLHFVSLVMRVRKIPPQKYKACSVSLSVKFLEMNYTAHMTSVASKDFFFFFFFLQLLDWIFYPCTTPFHLFRNLQLVISLHLLQESTLAAGVEHSLLDAAAVSRHGVDEHYKQDDRCLIDANAQSITSRTYFYLSDRFCKCG